MASLQGNRRVILMDQTGSKGYALIARGQRSDTDGADRK